MARRRESGTSRTISCATPLASASAPAPVGAAASASTTHTTMPSTAPDSRSVMSVRVARPRPAEHVQPRMHGRRRTERHGHRRRLAQRERLRAHRLALARGAAARARRTAEVARRLVRGARPVRALGVRDSSVLAQTAALRRLARTVNGVANGHPLNSGHDAAHTPSWQRVLPVGHASTAPHADATGTHSPLGQRFMLAEHASTAAHGERHVPSEQRGSPLGHSASPPPPPLPPPLPSPPDPPLPQSL